MTKAKPAAKPTTPAGPPSATVVFDGEERTIVFDMERLLDIEEFSGKTVLQLGADLQKCTVVDADGNQVKEPTQTQVEQACTRVSLREMQTFVGACMRAPRQKVPLQGLAKLYFALAGPFSKALASMMGSSEIAEQDGAEHPTEASGT